MKRFSLIASIALLSIAPLAAQSQAKQDEAYDFKGDRLGMSIGEFTTNHPGDGSWVYCSKCKDHKAWESTLCRENSTPIDGFTVCSYATTIAGIPASAQVLFADRKLAAISIGFSHPPIKQLALVPQGLTEKFGSATGEIKAEVSRTRGTV